MKTLRKMTMIDMEKDAKALLEEAKARNAKSKNAESKGAAPAPSAEKEKTEGIEDTEVVKAEGPAKNPDDKKSPDDSTDKPKVANAEDKEEPVSKNEAAEKPDEKKSHVQRRFDELTSKIKTLEADKEATKAEKEALRSELDGIKKQLSMTPQDQLESKIKDEMSKRRLKYLDEDKSKPREERREMSREELDEYAAEDYEGAQEWISKRTLRRIEEERGMKLEAEQKARAESILDEQDKSAAKTFAKHPELDVETRKNELLKEGKSKDEVAKILCQENPKYKLCWDIYHENPAKYMFSGKGPELVVEEMEKRLSNPSPKGSEIEELRKKIAEQDAEIERLKNLDDDIGSVRHADKPSESVLSKEQEKLAKELGVDAKKLGARVERRKVEFR